MIKLSVRDIFVAGLMFCAATVLARTDDEQTKARQQAVADVLAGRKLPPITPLPAQIDPYAIPLYPNEKVAGPDEQWDTYAGGPIARNVVRPTLRPYLPPPAKTNGATVIIAPGGAFKYLGIEGETARPATGPEGTHPYRHVDRVFRPVSRSGGATIQGSDYDSGV